MALIREKSCECFKSELDIFSVKPTQTSILEHHTIGYKPVSSLADNAPTEFVIPGHGDDYMDLAHTMLNIDARIVKANGQLLLPTDKTIGPVNDFLNAMFSEVQIYLNNKLISFPSHMHPYRSYFEKALNYDISAKSSHLQSALWYKDTAGAFDNVSEDNKGFTKRNQLTKQSKTFDMFGYLHSDIFNQEKFLINGVEMRIKLIPSKNTFCLMGLDDSEGKVEILDATLYVRKVSVSSSIKLSHNRILQKHTAKYPLTRVQLKAVTIPKDIVSKTIDNVILGRLPKRLVVGFVTNDAFNGTLSTNPFNFQHFNYNFFTLYVDGVQIPGKPLQPDFENNKYITAYHTLFSEQGYALLVFDITPDAAASAISHCSLQRQGAVSLEVHFKSALESTVTCVIYSEFDALMEINNQRDIHLD